MFRRFQKQPPQEVTLRLNLNDQEAVGLLNDLTAHLEEQLGDLTPEGRQNGSLLIGQDVRMIRQDTEDSLQKGVLVVTLYALTDQGAKALQEVLPHVRHLRVTP